MLPNIQTLNQAFQNQMLAAQLGVPPAYLNEAMADQSLTAALTAQMMASTAPSIVSLPNVVPAQPKQPGISAETIARRLANKAKAAANPSPAVSVITISSNEDDDGPGPSHRVHQDTTQKDGKQQAIVRPLQAHIKMEPPSSQQEILALMGANGGAH